MNRDMPAVAVMIERHDRRIKRTHRHRHVAGMGRDTLVAGAEYGKDAVEPADRVAAGAGATLVAAAGGVVEIIASGALEQVAPGGRLVAELSRGSSEKCAAQHLIAPDNAGVGRKIAVGHQRADAQAAVVHVLDIGQRQAADVDELLRRFDLQLHQIEEICPASDEAGRRRDVGGRGVGAGRLLVSERLHACPSATERIASLMLGYAEQRQTLPLIRSLISSSERSLDDSSSETWLGQPFAASSSMPTAEQT